MSDLYRELLIKREKRAVDTAKKVGLIILTVLAGAAILFLTPWAIAVFAGLCIFDYFIFQTFNVEYEYLYVNGELDIDKILSRTTRKKAGSYQITKMELLAPWKSHELDYYKNSGQCKVTDFSSGREDAEVYAMVYNGEKGMEFILFEPDKVILDDIRRLAPSKVKLY